MPSQPQALADALRNDASLIAPLCPDVGQPKAVALLNLMRAFALAQRLTSERQRAPSATGGHLCATGVA